MSNQLQAWNEQLQNKVEQKDRLRVMLLYPEAKGFLQQMKLVDAKKHVYNRNGEDRFTRYRLQVECGGKTENITAFLRTSGEQTVSAQVVMNGKLVKKESVQGTDFEQYFGTTEVGNEFLQRFFTDLDLDKVCTDLKKSK